MSPWNANYAMEINESVAVQYSLGLTVIGQLSETKSEENCSVNFVRVNNKDIYVDEPVEQFLSATTT